MVNLTFGEQVKIVLSRKGMTIKELAELIEARTGQKMSRQNLTQKLGRDNFQEQDMRQIAQILGCPFQLSILSTNESSEKAGEGKQAAETPLVRELTIGDLIDLQEIREAERQKEEIDIEEKRRAAAEKAFQKSKKPAGKDSGADVKEEQGNGSAAGDINPYTLREYETNSVRMHPKRIGYVQVYDRSEHKWTDMTQWAFLGYQERKKKLLGKKYVPPIYLD